MIVGRTINYNRLRNPVAAHRARWPDKLPALIASLFGNGEQGAMYVPQPKYLFQDAAGTTPVTADGDPVGLVLDPSRGGGYLSVNQFFHSENFSNAYWSKSGCAISDAGSTVPSTGSKVEKIVSTDGAGAVFINNSSNVSVAGNAITIYAKAAEWGGLCISPQNAQARTYFDLSAGVKGKTGSNVTRHEITDAGDGWWRCEVTFSTSSTTVRIFACTSTSSVSVVGDGASGVLVSGAMLQTASATPTEYERTTSTRWTNGSHATQSVSADRPLYQTDGTLHWLSHDQVGDNLVASLPDLGTNATLAYANAVGVTIFEGQTISGATTLPQEAELYGAIYLDRPLTAGETAQVTDYLNSLRGA